MKIGQWVLCGNCEKGVHTKCQMPCMCDLPGCGSNEGNPA